MGQLHTQDVYGVPLFTYTGWDGGVADGVVRYVGVHFLIPELQEENGRSRTVLLEVDGTLTIQDEKEQDVRSQYVLDFSSFRDKVFSRTEETQHLDTKEN